jgi:hypothetical protein
MTAVGDRPKVSELFPVNGLRFPNELLIARDDARETMKDCAVAALQFRKIGQCPFFHCIRPWLGADRIDLNRELVNDFTVPEYCVFDGMSIQSTFATLLEMTATVEIITFAKRGDGNSRRGLRLPTRPVDKRIHEDLELDRSPFPQTS